MSDTLEYEAPPLRDRDWRHRAACRGYDKLYSPGENPFDNDADLPYPPEAAKRVCDRCPVLAECLEAGWYLADGIWGGTTGYQRLQLRANRVHRARCPGCASTLVTKTDRGDEVCAACGLAWPRKVKPGETAPKPAGDPADEG